MTTGRSTTRPTGNRSKGRGIWGKGDSDSRASKKPNNQGSVLINIGK